MEKRTEISMPLCVRKKWNMPRRRLMRCIDLAWILNRQLSVGKMFVKSIENLEFRY